MENPQNFPEMGLLRNYADVRYNDILGQSNRQFAKALAEYAGIPEYSPVKPGGFKKLSELLAKMRRVYGNDTEAMLAAIARVKGKSRDKP